MIDRDSDNFVPVNNLRFIRSHCLELERRPSPGQVLESGVDFSVEQMSFNHAADFASGVDLDSGTFTMKIQCNGWNIPDVVKMCMCKKNSL